MPRISVFRSNNHIYAQLIDDLQGNVLVSSSSLVLKLKKGVSGAEAGKLVGADLAKKAISAKLKKAVFDRSGYKYHGIVKAVANGAREGGLKF